ncbi:MAG TPA: hypothetical protein VMZ52_16325 [Bryobacteraceae bacterium]|nr:hypothetical protein [Bryobacteraceae bacterium]
MADAPERGAMERSAPSDLWRHTLSQIPSVFGRLVYLSSLRSQTAGVYQHHGLSLLFGEKEADTALRNSHVEAFREWLEFTLEQQKGDLDLYLSELVDDRRTVIDSWSRLAPFRNLIPASAGQMEKSLYCSDFEALLAVLRSEYGVALPDPDA